MYHKGILVSFNLQQSVGNGNFNVLTHLVIDITLWP
jgi:hypothetical protein